ncbi:MAG TPA: hypothetical protein VIV60_34825 [Polyangiaceae bacterium]
MPYFAPTLRQGRYFGLVGAYIAVTLVLGCSGSDSSDGESNASATGGGTGTTNPNVGGVLASGGTLAAGGSSVTALGGQAVGGYLTSDGTGASDVGGRGSNTSVPGVGGRGSDPSATGGLPEGGRGGTGTIRAIGGRESNGGAPHTGGFVSVGGSAGTGGSALGGSKPTGGAPSVAGSRATGGATNSGSTLPKGGSTAGGGTKSSTGTCYTAPAEEIGTQARTGTISGYGTVSFWAKTPHDIVRLHTTMVVPPKPPASGTLFLWPGIQPFGANFDPIDNGVLQPVLTWGPTCAPTTKPRSYSTWWISGQYVNTNGSEPGYTGCASGPALSVEVCDTLDIDIALSGTVWRQTVIDERTDQTVTYDIDLQNQSQNLAYFVIEEYSSTPVSEVIFTDTTLTFNSPDAADCKVYMRGQTDFVSTPTASSDGLSCTIPQIILRANGIQ